MPDWLLQALFGTTVGGGLLGALVKLAKVWLHRRGVDRHILGLRALSEIYSALNWIASIDGVSRAMLLRSSNGGGVPGPGNKAYVAVLHESFTDSGDSVDGRWDVREADDHYTSLLHHIQAAPSYVRLVTEDLPQRSALRELYEDSGTLKSRIYRIGVSPRAMLYVSINFKTDRRLSPREENSINHQIGRIRKVFDEHSLY